MEDWDLEFCLQYNPQDFVFADVDAVLAVIEGEHDGADWRWFVRLKDGRYAGVQGGCDYTGWDCQSNADSRVGKTTREALSFFDADDAKELRRQIRKGKAKTLRQEVGEALGLL